MKTRYGRPLRCPTCVTRILTPGLERGSWFVVDQVSQVWLLKVPSVRADPCPHCGTRLVSTRRER